MPWSKGYFSLESDPIDARVVVDGVDRGAAPLVVEVDPAVLHRVELRKDKYFDYQADLRALPARKVSFEPVLDLKPGSIKVVTNPPGAQVRLDDGEFLQTPCTFQEVPAGTHTLSVGDVLAYPRYYTSDKTFTVEVNPEEQSVLTPEMVPGTGKLAILDAPESGTVTLDGNPLNSPLVFTVGADILAGNYDLVVKNAAGQTWEKTIWVPHGTSARVFLDEMTATVPRKTIKVDGKADDWAGMESLWGGFTEKVGKYWVQPPTSKSGSVPRHHRDETERRLAGPGRFEHLLPN